MAAVDFGFPNLTDISGNPSFTPSFTGGAGGSAYSSAHNTSNFNTSGWTVNTGSGSASGAPAAASNPLVLIGLAVAGLFAWKMFLKRK